MHGAWFRFRAFKRSLGINYDTLADLANSYTEGGDQRTRHSGTRVLNGRKRDFFGRIARLLTGEIIFTSLLTMEL